MKQRAARGLEETCVLVSVDQYPISNKNIRVSQDLRHGIQALLRD